MEDLVERTEIVDAELVRAVKTLLPGESLERILDETRNIILKRALDVVKSRQFSTVIHLVEHLKNTGLTREDAMTILTWIHSDEAVPDEFRLNAKAVLDTGLFKTVFDFVAVPKPNKWTCICFRPSAD